jgi:hypothetical protein
MSKIKNRKQYTADSEFSDQEEQKIDQTSDSKPKKKKRKNQALSKEQSQP